MPSSAKKGRSGRGVSKLKLFETVEHMCFPRKGLFKYLEQKKNNFYI